MEDARSMWLTGSTKQSSYGLIETEVAGMRPARAFALSYYFLFSPVWLLSLGSLFIS